MTQPFSLILGIDPGFSGALALYSSKSTAPKDGLIGLWDMPVLIDSTLENKISPAKPIRSRKSIDALSLCAILKPFAGRIDLAVLERVSAMPDDGVVSAFRFGCGVGVIQGVLASMNIKTLQPTPSVWKAGMGVTADKNTSLAMARGLFGDYNAGLYFPLKKHDGRAEAALLAYYGLKMVPATSQVMSFDDLV